MLCVAEPSPVTVESRCCTICGVDQPLTSFSPSPSHPLGVDPRCRGCRNAAGRIRNALQRRTQLPAVIGLTTGESVTTAVLGALRQHYNGRPAGLLADLRRTLAEVSPVDRLNAMLTLLALREIGSAGIAVSRQSAPMAHQLADLPDAEVSRLLVEREQIIARRSPPV